MAVACQGQAQSECNLNFKSCSVILIFYHNLIDYDCKLLIKKTDKFMFLHNSNEKRYLIHQIAIYKIIKDGFIFEIF